jgi:hypothetical protein
VDLGAVTDEGGDPTSWPDVDHLLGVERERRHVRRVTPHDGVPLLQRPGRVGVRVLAVERGRASPAQGRLVAGHDGQLPAHGSQDAAVVDVESPGHQLHGPGEELVGGPAPYRGLVEQGDGLLVSIPAAPGGDLATGDHDAPDRRILQQVVGGRLQPPPGPVPVAHAVLEDDPGRVAGYHLAEPVDGVSVVGMEQVEGVGAHQLGGSVAQLGGDGGRAVAVPAVSVVHGDDVPGGADQCLQPPSALGQPALVAPLVGRVPHVDHQGAHRRVVEEVAGEHLHVPPGSVAVEEAILLRSGATGGGHVGHEAGPGPLQVVRVDQIEGEATLEVLGAQAQHGERCWGGVGDHAVPVHQHGELRGPSHQGPEAHLGAGHGLLGGDRLGDIHHLAEDPEAPPLRVAHHRRGAHDDDHGAVGTEVALADLVVIHQAGQHRLGGCRCVDPVVGVGELHRPVADQLLFAATEHPAQRRVDHPEPAFEVDEGHAGHGVLERLAQPDALSGGHLVERRVAL